MTENHEENFQVNPFSSTDGQPDAKQIPVSNALPRLWTAWTVIGVSFVVMIVVSVLAAFAYIMPHIVALIGNEVSNSESTEKLTDKFMTPEGFLATGFPPQLAMLFIALAAGYYSPVPFKERLGLTNSGLTGLQTLIVAIGAF